MKDLPYEAEIEAGLLEARDTISILCCLQLRNGLPDPKGSRSLHLPPQAIALANSEVKKLLVIVARSEAGTRSKLC